MEIKKILIIGFLLITLVVLPVSFAADVDSNDLGVNLNSNDLNVNANPNDLGVNLNSNDLDGNLSLEKENNRYLSSEIIFTSVKEDLDSPNNLMFSNNDTIYINASYTGTDESGNLSNPYKNISVAMINILGSNKTNLFIANGVYTINNHFDINNRNINIIGESTTGVKINCNNNYLFAFRNSSSNICNLTIYNALSKTEYAVIWTELSNITMFDVVFTNNLANSPGGIILSKGGTFKLINSSIKNNLIDYDGGISGGIIYSDKTDFSIINSSFINNTIKCTSYAGGAIYVRGSLEFINSSISSLFVNSDDIIDGAFIYYEQSDNFDRGCIINSSFEKSKFNNVSGLILTNSRSFIIQNVNISNINASYLQGNISVLDLYYNSFIENLNIFNNTYNNVSVSLSSIMNFLYRNGYFIISEALPDRYDLRDYNLITIPKNQSPHGTCWAFATISALESYLLKYWNESFDLSENNMKNIMGKNGINGSEWDTNTGGNDVLALAYLLRWSGAVNESDDSYYSSYSKIYDAVCHVQDVIYIPLRLNYTDNDQIKYAIMKYGAVFTEMHAMDGVLQKNVYSPICRNSDHAVVIVGWDDKYSASNFAITPPGDGAFIVKNSWGSNWGDNGYFYVSYYDASFAGFSNTSKFSGFVFTNVEKTDNYNYIYYYDPFGNDYVAAGYLSNTGYFANQFVSNGKEILSAFGIYTYGDSNYSANIYINEKLVYTQNGSLYGSGYHTIKLNQLFGLNTGDIFKIAIKLITPNCIYPIAIEDFVNGFVNATASYNQSFVSFDGLEWYDLTSIDGFSRANVCLKAYTLSSEDLISINPEDIVVHEGDNISLNLTIKNLDGENINISEGNFIIIFPDSTQITPNVSNSGISFTVPDVKKSGIAKIIFIHPNYPNLFADLKFHISSDVFLNLTNKTVYLLDNNSYSIKINNANGKPVSAGTITLYKNGSKLGDFAVKNGVVVWSYKFDSIGKYIISVIYTGNEYYTNTSGNMTITVNKTPVTITINQFNKYYKEKYITLSLSKVISGQKLTLKFSNGKTVNVTTNSKGIATYYIPYAPGTYNLTVSGVNNKYDIKTSTLNKLIIYKSTATISLSKFTTTYKSGKYLQIKLINSKTGKAQVGVKLKLKVYTKSKYKNVYITTGTDGIAKYYCSSLSVASHKIIVSIYESSNYITGSSKTNYIIVKKANTIVSAPKVVNKYKTNNYFKVAIKNAITNKAVSGLTLKIKVFTGKKYLIYKVKTNSKGVAQINTKYLSKATHKVIISTSSSYYRVNKSGYLIVIKK